MPSVPQLRRKMVQTCVCSVSLQRAGRRIDTRYIKVVPVIICDCLMSRLSRLIMSVKPFRTFPSVLFENTMSFF